MSGTVREHRERGQPGPVVISGTDPTRTWMWPPRGDTRCTSVSAASIAVHGCAPMSDPPSRQANRASGVHTRADPTGVCMSTTATRPPGRDAAIISDTARGRFAMSDTA